MKYQQLSRCFALFGLAAMFALGVTNCGADVKSNARLVSTPDGEAGEAGQPSLLLCGQPGTLSQCDPVTALPCDIAGGQTCEYSSVLGAFKCGAFPTRVAAG